MSYFPPPWWRKASVFLWKSTVNDGVNPPNVSGEVLLTLFEGLCALLGYCGTLFRHEVVSNESGPTFLSARKF